MEDQVLDLAQLIELQENEFSGHNIDEGEETPEKEVEIEESEQEEEEEEEQPVKEEDQEIIPTTETEVTEEQPDPVKAHFEFAKEQGIIEVPEDFEFDGSSESLQQAYAHTDESRKKAALAAVLGNMPEDFHSAFKYAINGGSFSEFLNATGFSKVNLPTDISSKESQVQVIKNYYKETTNYSDDKINSMIDRLDKMEALEEEAEEAVEYLEELRSTAAEELVKQKAEQEKAAKEALKESRRLLDEAVTNLESIPNTRKPKVKAYLNNVVSREDGENTDFNRAIRNISVNAEHKAQLADFLHSTYDPKKGFDLSRYIKQGKSQATNDFKSSLEEKLDIKSRMSKGKTFTPTKEVPWSEILKQYD